MRASAGSERVSTILGARDRKASTNRAADQNAPHLFTTRPRRDEGIDTEDEPKHHVAA
jgi:hypothetical protein